MEWKIEKRNYRIKKNESQEESNGKIKIEWKGGREEKKKKEIKKERKKKMKLQQRRQV